MKLVTLTFVAFKLCGFEILPGGDIQVIRAPNLVSTYIVPEHVVEVLHPKLSEAGMASPDVSHLTCSLVKLSDGSQRYVEGTIDEVLEKLRKSK